MQTPQGQKLGPTGQRLAKNVETVRGRIPLREVSTRLEAIGRKILPSGIMNIERGTRRVDTDDLVALAIALEVTPNRLLLPVDGRERIPLTPNVSASPLSAWEWATGEAQLKVNLAWKDPQSALDPVERMRFRAENQPHRERPEPDVPADLAMHNEVTRHLVPGIHAALAAGLTEEQVTTWMGNAYRLAKTLMDSGGSDG